MEIKHTPGQWTVHSPTKTDGRLMVLHPDGTRVIAKLNEGHISSQGIIAESERQANARLIASCPELLKACHEARNLYDHLALGTLEAAVKYGPDYEPPTDEDCLEVRDLLETVINKAGG